MYKPTIVELKGRWGDWEPVSISSKSFLQQRHNPFNFNNNESARRAQHDNSPTWEKHRVVLYSGFWVLLRRLAKNKAYREPQPSLEEREEAIQKEYYLHQSRLIRLEEDFREHGDIEMADTIDYVLNNFLLETGAEYLDE